MPTKPLPIDKPTRRTVEELFRSTRRGYDRYSDLVYRRLCDEERELEARLLDVPEMRELKERQGRAREAHNKLEKQIDARVDQVHRLYLSRGLTPAVRKKLDELVEFVNSQESGS